MNHLQAPDRSSVVLFLFLSAIEEDEEEKEKDSQSSHFPNNESFGYCTALVSVIQ